MPNVNLRLIPVMLVCAVLAACSDRAPPLTTRQAAASAPAARKPDYFPFVGRTVYEYNEAANLRSATYFEPSGNMYLINNRGQGDVIIYRPAPDGYCVGSNCYYFGPARDGMPPGTYFYSQSGLYNRVVGYKDGDPDGVGPVAIARSRQAALQAAIPLIPWVAKGIELGMRDAGTVVATPIRRRCFHGGIVFEGSC